MRQRPQVQVEAGLSYIALTLTTIAFSVVVQALVTRVGIRPILPLGLALSTVALVLFARLPVHGHYFSNLFPGFLISGLGLALAFIPMSIGALTGVRPEEAGVASGLINTSQQIGGRHRRRDRHDRRNLVHGPLRRRPHRVERVQRARFDARVPDRVLRPRWAGGSRCADLCAHARIAPGTAGIAVHERGFRTGGRVTMTMEGERR